MCFSATASFTSAAVLGVVGFVSLKNTSKPNQFMFAAIPMLFAVQQVSEGFLWLSLMHSADYYWHSVAMYTFLFFAQMFWCTWIPLSFLLIEKDQIRKALLKLISFLGIIASCLLGYRLVNHPVPIEIIGHHIHYDINSPKPFIILSSILYVLSTVAPCFLSSVKKTKLLGLLLVVALIISKIFYEAFFISVWCFFSAVISIAILFVIKDLKNNSEDELGYNATKSVH
jgi:hypothetical protein